MPPSTPTLSLHSYLFITELGYQFIYILFINSIGYILFITELEY